MKPLLSRETSEVLATVACSRVLLAFDFDGTLAPIIERRDDACMRDQTTALFAIVCRLYPCAVISGRAKADVTHRLGDAAVEYIIGNHGLEPGAGLDQFEQEMALARSLLTKSLATCADVDIEDKRYTLALHYRASDQERDVRAAIHDAVRELPMPVRLVPGRMVVNLVPAHAPNKGDALLALRAEEQADTALYVGDDDTDEDVFVLGQPGSLLTVRVGESRASSASYYLRDQLEVDELLARLISLREKRLLP